MFGISILSLLILILDVWAIISVLGGSGTTGHKLLWVLLILFLPLVGLILYLLLGRSTVDQTLL